MPSRLARFSALLLAAVVALSSLALLPLPQREVPAVKAAATTQIGLTAPFLGNASRQVPSGDVRHIDTQMGIIRSYGVKVASVWGDFQSNYLRADDIDKLYQNGIRTFVVRVGAHAPCDTDPTHSPLTYNFITGRLMMSRPYNTTTATLVQRLNSYLGSDTGVKVYIQLGNEPDLEYDANCDGLRTDSIAELRDYSNTLANLAPQMRTWINQNFGSNASRVFLAAGTVSGSPGTDYSTRQSQIDAVFNNPGVLNGFDAFSINVYAYQRFYNGSLSYPIDSVQAMRYLKQKVGSKTVYVGETGVGTVQGLTGWGLPNIVGEGSGGTRQPGIVKGYSLREFLLDPNNNIAFGLLFTLGCWYEQNSPDVVTQAECQNLSTPVRPFQASADANDRVSDYRKGFSRNLYILDRALLDTVFARIPESGVSFNPACLYSGTGCSVYNYVADGAQSVGGSIYVYGNRLGWWFNPSLNRWMLVAERGALSETQSSNEEFGFLRAIQVGYLCASTGSTVCKDTGKTIGRFRVILRCDSGTGPGNCYIRNVNGTLKRNPFDSAAVVRDSTACPHYDSVSGFQVCGHFWTDHVSRMGRQRGDAGISDQERIALLGRPISTHFSEKVTIGTNVCYYLVQYFERGVLRYEHPNGLAPGSSSGCTTTTTEPWDAPLIRLGAGIPRSHAAESEFNVHVDGTVGGVLEVYRMQP